MNGLIIAEYNFRDDEIIAYYINLLKCVSIRIELESLQLFYNLVCNSKYIEIQYIPYAYARSQFLQAQRKFDTYKCSQHCTWSHKN